MKKVIGLIFCASLALNAMAQDSSYSNMKSDTGAWHNRSQKGGSSMMKTKYCVSMSNGKMVVMKGSETVTASVNLDDGSMLSTDGTLTKKDGSKTMLKDGDCIDKSGMMTKKKTKKATSSR